MSNSTQPAVADDAANLARAGRLTVRLVGYDLDAPSLELIMAALAAEVCDEINTPDA